MQIKVEKVDGVNAKVEAKISKELLKKKEDKIVDGIAKNAKLDGFRQGKVPKAIVKERNKNQIEQDVNSQALRELLDLAIEELEMEIGSIIGEPQVSKFEKVADGVETELKISFRPNVTLEGYEECIPEIKTPRVTKKEVQERIDDMLKGSAPFKDAEEGKALEKGDFAVIDFEGFIDGEPFQGGKAEGYSLEIGSGSFIPGFEDALIGMKIGEEQEINVNFPKEYHSADFAGKPAMFKVKLNKIQTKDIPEKLDVEDVRKFLPEEENLTVELFEEKVKDQIKSEKLSKLYNEDIKPKFVEKVVEKITFDLPENIVEQEIDMILKSSLQGKKPEELNEYKDNPDKLKEERDSLREDASNSVKLTFIVDELSRKEEISVSDEEVNQMIYLEAMQRRQDPKAYLEEYEKKGLLPSVKMAIIEDRLFGKIFDTKRKAKK